MPGLKLLWRVISLVTVALYAPSAVADSPGYYPAPWHEFMLVLVGAVFGGFLGPILQALDFWLGVTPGAKQLRENYKVQREIAASLRELVQQSRPLPSDT